MDFFDALVRYEIDLWNHLDTRLRAAGAPSLATLGALRVIQRHGGRARVHELRTEMRITVGAASKLVDRLEHEGLAERRPHPDDRRSSLLALTDAGRSAHDAGLAVLETALAEHLRSADVEALTGELDRLGASLVASAGATR